MSFNFSFAGAGNDDEDDFGALSSNSNLASIFNQEAASALSSKKTLVYAAPKQPANPTSSAQQSQSVIFATAVTCYKLANEKYEPLQGKTGLAVIGENENKAHRLILYQNKQKPLASVKLTPDFILTSQPDNFCTFYDDRKQNWAILLDSKELAKKFVEEVERVIRSGSVTKVSSSNMPKENSTKDIVNNIPIASTKQENKKTNIISRIAKMGQPILPLSGVAGTENSDSDQVIRSSPEPELDRNRLKKSRPLPPKPTMSNEHIMNTMMVPTQYNAMHSTMPINMMQYVPAFNASCSTSPFDILLSETRTQNSEIRMHLCRLSDKVDLSLQNKSATHPRTPPPTPPDNNLREEMNLNFHKLQNQSRDQMAKLEKILELFQTHQASSVINPADEVERLTADRDALAVSLKESNCIVEKLKEDKSRLISRLEATSQLKEDNEKWLLSQKKCAELEGQLLQCRNTSEVKDQQLEKLQQQVVQLEKEAAQSQSMADSLQSKLSQLEVTASQKARQVDPPQVSDQVKLIMNKVYKESMKQFQPEETYSFRSIKSTLSQIIRDVTLSILNGESLETQPDDGAKENHSDSTQVEENGSEAAKIQSGSQQILEESVAQVNKAPQVMENNLNDKVADVSTIAEINDQLEGLKCQLIEVEDVQPVVTETAVIPESAKESPTKSIEEDCPKVQEESKKSVSFLESLHSSLAAAQTDDQVWKPEPPPPPLFDDFVNDDDDDWLT